MILGNILPCKQAVYIDIEVIISLPRIHQALGREYLVPQRTDLAVFRHILRLVQIEVPIIMGLGLGLGFGFGFGFRVGVRVGVGVRV